MGTLMIKELFEVGLQVVLFLCLFPFMPCLLFSVPLCAALTKQRSLQGQQSDGVDIGARPVETGYMSVCGRLRIWIAIWCIAAVILFLVGYVDSAGIRYYQKPLETPYRLGHGALMLGIFYAPTFYILAVSVLLARHPMRRRSLILRTHLWGFAVYALTATAVEISISMFLGFLKFKLPSGYNPGFIEPAPIILYSSAIGLLFASCSIAVAQFTRGTKRHFPSA